MSHGQILRLQLRIAGVDVEILKDCRSIPAGVRLPARIAGKKGRFQQDVSIR